MDYLYLWVIFAVLCAVTAFVFKKASKSMRAHNDGQKQVYAEIERLKSLKAQYKNADMRTIEKAEPRELLAGAYAVLQSKLERAENPDALFDDMPEPCRYIYTLSCFTEDVQTEGLTFFFKNNGAILLQCAVSAFEAVGQTEAAEIIRAEYAMFDENNEEVSLDTEQFSKFDTDFKAVYDAEKLLEAVKQYILEHHTEILGNPPEEEEF